MITFCTLFILITGLILYCIDKKSPEGIPIYSALEDRNNGKFILWKSGDTFTVYTKNLLGIKHQRIITDDCCIYRITDNTEPRIVITDTCTEIYLPEDHCILEL